MKEAGVPSAAWLTNVAAAVAGLLLLTLARHIPHPRKLPAQFVIAAAALAAILLPFASRGMMGVHRWVSVGGFSLQPAAIVAPLIITCIAAIARRHRAGAIAIAVLATTILALQPDAAQAVGVAAACIALLLFNPERRSSSIIGATLLLIAAAAAFIQQDPLPPVAHVEKIHTLVASGGPAWAALGATALLLLPLPFFALFVMSRDPLTIALTMYVTMTVLAPFWGTFPVPVMGYGVSHVLGYFIALAVCTSAIHRRDAVPRFSP